MQIWCISLHVLKAGFPSGRQLLFTFQQHSAWVSRELGSMAVLVQTSMLVMSHIILLELFS